jgi:hypothetical protein
MPLNAADIPLVRHQIMNVCFSILVDLTAALDDIRFPG